MAEDEAAYESTGETWMSVPSELVSAVREMIAKHEARALNKMWETKRRSQHETLDSQRHKSRR